MEENTSGYGEYTVIPSDVKRWNWGAFWLTWIWGLFNKSYISFLMFLPIANFVIPFYLGVKGNELAWKNNKWDSVEEFHEIQKGWAVAGWIIGLLIIVILFGTGFSKYKIQKQKVEFIQEVMEIVIDHKETNQIIDKEYEIVGTLGSLRSTKQSYSKDGIYSYNIFVNSKGKMYTIIVKMDENRKIKSIVLYSFPKEEGLKINIM